eukprot:TRINITY_DN7366_c0_g1_i4.p1 TRINITY_DN7366_c0_g1~~TRINITY_DN7366_c0_g1_i4.p1  ORF type:complete len:421 (-),score=164.25 TRINITY_DN7366_c0_g1_i4:354-1616(-)
MSDWANKFSHFDRGTSSSSRKSGGGLNGSFKHNNRSRYTPLTQSSVGGSGLQNCNTTRNGGGPLAAALRGNGGGNKIFEPMMAAPPPKKTQTFSFRSEKVAAVPIDDWTDDDFDEEINDADLNSAMDALEQTEAMEEENKRKNSPKISDEELQEMTMAIMDDEWLFDVEEDEPKVPGPKDSAKARLNQTTAVLGGPCVDDFFDDGPKPDEIIQNLKDENKKLETELRDIKPKVMAKESERQELKVKLDAKQKELEKEARLRRNLEMNMKKELDRAQRATEDKEKELRKLKSELNKDRAKSTTSLQDVTNSTDQGGGGMAAKKRKLSATALNTSYEDSDTPSSNEESKPPEEIKLAFDPLGKLDLPDFFLDQFSLLGCILEDEMMEGGTHVVPQAFSKQQDTSVNLENNSSDDEIPELSIY